MTEYAGTYLGDDLKNAEAGLEASCLRVCQPLENCQKDAKNILQNTDRHVGYSSLACKSRYASQSAP